MVNEQELESVLLLLEEYGPNLNISEVGIDFGSVRGFGIRVHPKGQSVSYLFFHNGLEWQARREDESRYQSGMGFGPDELESAVIGIFFLIGQLALDYKMVQGLPHMAQMGNEMLETLEGCRDALTAMASDSSLKRADRKWAAEALRALS
jgi:hypothetical protein